MTKLCSRFLFVGLLSVATNANAQTPAPCAGSAWDVVAPMRPLEDAPRPMDVVLSEGPLQDAVRIRANGDVVVQRFGVFDRVVCRLEPSRWWGLHETLSAAGIPSASGGPSTTPDEWFDLSLRYDDTNHFVRVALNPSAPAPPGALTLRNNLWNAANATAGARTLDDRLMDEVRRLIVVWSKGRSLPALHGGLSFIPDRFQLVSHRLQGTTRRLLVRWSEGTMSDTAREVGRGGGRNDPPAVPATRERTESFVFRQVPGGWLLQRPSSMPSQRPRNGSPLDYPGAGERHGVEAPAFSARIVTE